MELELKMSDFRPPERIKNALDSRKLHLTTRCPGDSTKFSSFTWQLVANNPRLVVWTNDPSDTGEANGYGKITANLDAPTFTAFLQLLGEVIDSPGEKKEYLENRNYIFPKGVRSETPVLISTLYCGKDKDGIIWISLVAKNRPIIKFTFGEGEFHHFFNGDGTPADKAKVSQRYARAYIKLLYGIMETLLVNLWVEPPKRDYPGKKDNSNGVSNQNDDIPF